MKKVGKWIISLIIIAIVAFIVYVVVMAYKTSQEWTVTIKFNDFIVKEIKVLHRLYNLASSPAAQILQTFLYITLIQFLST